MKKINFLKYIFIIFVIILIGYAIYYIRGQEEQQEEISEVTVEEKPNYTTINTLRLAAVNIDTINPILSHNQNVQEFSKLIYEPLLTITENFEIEKSLAKEWISLSDTAYVIVLKENAKFHNGDEITANDVKYTVEKIKELGDNSIFYPNVENIIDVEVLSIYTVKISIDKKIPFFEYNLTFPIMSSKYFEDEAIEVNEKANNAPGTGKYYINNISPTEIELKKNEDWWGISEGKELSLQTIIIKLYSSMGEVYNAFKLGNLDLITTQSLNYEDYIGTIGYNTIEYVGREHQYLALNCNSRLLGNLELRQAINFAIDKSNIVATVFENKYYVADFPLNRSNFLYQIDKVSSSFNANKSREVLEDSGWEFKSGVWTKTENYVPLRAKLNFVVNEQDENRLRVAEIIKKQLEDFGININLIKANSNQYNKYLENKNYDMILTGKLCGISPDISSYVLNDNLSQYNQEEMEQLIDEIANITDDQEKLIKDYKKIIKLVEDEKPFISLCFNRNTIIYNPNLKGKINPNFYNIFYNIDEWIIQY